MNAVTKNMKWIMLVSGVLTCTMIYAAIDPRAAVLSMFGETLEGPLAEIMVRNWGVLVALHLDNQVAVALAIDALWVVIFAIYLMSRRPETRAG